MEEPDYLSPVEYTYRCDFSPDLTADRPPHVIHLEWTQDHRAFSFVGEYGKKDKIKPDSKYSFQFERGAFITITSESGIQKLPFFLIAGRHGETMLRGFFVDKSPRENITALWVNTGTGEANMYSLGMYAIERKAKCTSLGLGKQFGAHNP
jgi:hypothetical protein